MSLTNVCDENSRMRIPIWRFTLAPTVSSTLNYCEIVFHLGRCYHPIVNQNEEEADMSDRDGNSFVWFLAGLGIGAIVGVLYAPRSGDETREVLLSKAQEGRDRVRHHARKAREQAEDWMERGRDAVSQQKEQLRSAYEAGRQKYRETTTAGAEPPSGV